MDWEGCLVDGDRKRISFHRVLQSIVVLAWIVAFWFLFRIEGGPLLGKFLRADYWWLAELGTTILVIFLLSLAYYPRHDCGRCGVGLVIRMGIMVLPLLYLPTAGVSQLSPDAAKKRSFYVAQYGHIKSKTARPSTSRSSTSVTDPLPTASSDLDIRENLSLLRLV